MSQPEVRFRQIHMDFHTSEMIDGIGADFDPDRFADTLQRAHVDSVTCFGRCHHGWIYYDTEAFPQRRHPHMADDLLRAQIDACHARGIRVPIYLTVQWDHYTAERHPEWLCIGADGRVQGTPPYEAGFYRKLCVNTPYVDFLKAHIRELLQTLPTDGLFLDIVQSNDCSCSYCKKGMLQKGIDPADAASRQAYGLEVVNGFKRELTAFIRQYSEDCSIFYNAGHIGPRHRRIVDAYSHLELESLPSGGWGYLHFPLTVRYARNLGVDCLGMTGKFHTSWGDFHSFKNPAALQFECFSMLALGAKCSIGDQLHPTGEICQTTYELVGQVYAEVEQKEPWCGGARPLSDIGVLSPEEFLEGSARVPLPAMGAVRMLQEEQQQFEILDSTSDFSQYRLLVLPDVIPVDAALADKLAAYLAEGGALVASHLSGLGPDGEDFALTELGLKRVGDAPYAPDFVVPQGDIGQGMAATGHAMYLRGLEVEALAGAEVLAQAEVPYFNRSWRHFCSHKHTPSSGKAGYPAIVRQGRCIYLSHPVFAQYAQNAPRWCRGLVANAIRLLLPEPLVQVEGPSTILSALNEQPQKNRRVLHLLHYIPERRGQDFDVVEDVIPLYDLTVRVRGDVPGRVVCQPQGETLEAQEVDGYVAFVVPRVEGHQMVVLED